MPERGPRRFCRSGLVLMVHCSQVQVTQAGLVSWRSRDDDCVCSPTQARTLPTVSPGISGYGFLRYEPWQDSIRISMSDLQRTGAKRWSKNRRSERLELHVPVVVYRRSGEGPPFYENSQTLVVSAHGALIPLKGLVATQQRLLVQNTNSGEQQECRVVSINNELTGPCKIAVEFTQPSPRFWRVAYPPADWTSSN